MANIFLQQQINKHYCAACDLDITPAEANDNETIIKQSPSSEMVGCVDRTKPVKTNR